MAILSTKTIDGWPDLLKLFENVTSV